MKHLYDSLRGIVHHTVRVPSVEAIRLAHDALRAKLLPQIYSPGFLNPDVDYFV